MFDAWVWRMAWRDSKGSRRRLLLFLSSMVIGVAALVAINSFGYSLKRAVETEAKTLLGADMSLESDHPFTPDTEAIIDSLGGDQARRVSFSSMAYFPSVDHTRLSTVRAHAGAYPFYGAIGTEPPGVAKSYLSGRNALVDQSLMKEFGVALGDTVRIGSIGYAIVGALVKTPREAELAMIFSPRIYIPLAHVDTALVSFGSRVEHEVYFRFPPEVDTEAIRETLRPHLDEYDVGLDTVEEMREEWGGALGDLYRFLSLVALIALVLGGLGVGSSVHVYVKQRLATVAILRCLGASSNRTFWVYLVQALVMGAIAGLAGCLLGIAVQYMLPGVVAEFLPIDIEFRIAPTALPVGLGLGLGTTVLFALLPLLSVRKVAPLLAIRLPFESGKRKRDSLRWGVYALLAGSLIGFAALQTENATLGLAYGVALIAVFGLLCLVATVLMRSARAFMPTSLHYLWRQGLANLYRPNNQTLLMMLAVGLSAFLIMVLVLVESMLVAQISTADREDRPDMVFFDIQPGQLDGVMQLVRDQGLPVIDQSPIVTMRIHAIGATTINDMRKDSTTHVGWAHRREYRSTYRDRITDAERVVEGEFVGAFAEDGALVPVSVERELATDELRVGIGDTIVFDVQGRLVETRVASLREVDWQRMQSNFFVVFPTGVLENAPQNHILMTRADDEDARIGVQAAIVVDYPNVSSISLALVLAVFDELFGRISFVVRFMALFSILAGMLVLIGAVVISRYKRIAESVLLKTLGASRRQVRAIMLIEYLFLGVLSALTGLVLAYGAGWGLATYVFEVPFVAAPGPLFLTVFAVIALIMAIGMANSRGIYARPALEVLRTQV